MQGINVGGHSTQFSAMAQDGPSCTTYFDDRLYHDLRIRFPDIPEDVIKSYINKSFNNREECEQQLCRYMRHQGDAAEQPLGQHQLRHGLRLNLSDAARGRQWKVSPAQGTPPQNALVNPTDLMPFLSSARNPQNTTSIACVNYGPSIGDGAPRRHQTPYSPTTGRVMAQVSLMERQGAPPRPQYGGGGSDSPGGTRQPVFNPRNEPQVLEPFASAGVTHPPRLRVDQQLLSPSRSQHSALHLRIPTDYSRPLFVNTATSPTQQTTTAAGATYTQASTAYTSNVNIVLSNPSTPTTQPVNAVPGGSTAAGPTLYLEHSGGSYDNPTYDLPELPPRLPANSNQQSPQVVSAFAAQGAAPLPISSRATQDDAYTQALLLRQRTRRERLQTKLSTARKVLLDLRNDVGELEQAVLQRQNPDQNVGLATIEELKALRRQNTQLKIEVQCMTKEVDISNRREPNSTGQSPNPEEDEGPEWACSACTLRNHPALKSCEVCEMPRFAQGP
ncbi:PREDICTED: TGF-beta-activated kinase 1 and MAP3K7-binding protein 3-like [Priapulus caudatus]|uniref:TGF-beta-activated kinase 1 and MAP3K7-binding protein 3-like n=1 Tax=Priapulus caudatus TaxID=37621 RepID=A0ABM1DVX8_PRICU|nr:PREDICTED: TGF-beta-activated kinase 1 and MAP3K7-binding protein 3-like [Priapulus caudatus]XP_014664098.1 PREDICTED: TGF-beta-activated kinase 1 and MAP3K7-binding protein 3-like [Priapulus caudatus]XP_014664099.1 PREDICTED: TGF-beta-activated kinase 1 and MAP3K7-binding protein 3-like [Priapulus caudatus]